MKLSARRALSTGVLALALAAPIAAPPAAFAAPAAVPVAAADHCDDASPKLLLVGPSHMEADDTVTLYALWRCTADPAAGVALRAQDRPSDVDFDDEGQVTLQVGGPTTLRLWADAGEGYRSNTLVIKVS